MADPGPFPDIEVLVMDLLADLGTTGSQSGTDLETTLPFIRVNRIGGADDRITDSARIVVDVFQSTRPLVQQLAETVRQRLINFPHVLDGAVIDRVVTISAPQEISWGVTGARSAYKGHSSVRRFTATYTVYARR